MKHGKYKSRKNRKRATGGGKVRAYRQPYEPLPLPMFFDGSFAAAAMSLLSIRNRRIK